MKNKHPSYIESDPTLLAQQKIIDSLKSIKIRKRLDLRFPSDLELAYQAYRTHTFFSSESKVLFVGVFIYLAYAWSDVAVGGEFAFLIAGIRVSVGLIMITILAFLVYSKTTDGTFIDKAIGVMLFLAFQQVILSSMLIDAPMNYLYIVGVIPIQVFGIIAQRLNYRIMLSVSLLSSLSYLGVVLFDQRDLAGFGFDGYLDLFVPVFVTFWLILAGVGGYVNFVMESSYRKDFLNNRILSLEAEHLNYMMELLKKLSTTDVLTGLDNRREFDLDLQDKWQHNREQKSAISLLMIDVDFFKQYNDSYGHQMGDKCLQFVADSLTQNIDTDEHSCARYGGEEFIVILPDTSMDNAIQIAETIRQAVLGKEIEHNSSPFGVCSVSIGVSTCSSISPCENPDALLKRADMSLYKAKEKGRNLVIADR